MTQRYAEIEMPPRFDLEVECADGVWRAEARCSAGDFERLADGSYLCSSGASGFWLRCVSERADHFCHLAGDGTLHRYRVVELPTFRP